MTDAHNKAALAHPTDQPNRMHPLVQVALQQGGQIDTATMRELLAIQKEWEANEARKRYHAALAALKIDLPTVLDRDKPIYHNKVYKYSHTTLAHAMDAITAPLLKHGFSLSWDPANDGKLVSVTCILTHVGGHSESSTLSAPPDISGSKSPVQAIASTVTLLQRYTALARLGIATRDMGEPTAAASAPKGIDVRKNMDALTAVKEKGLSQVAAEKLTGKPISQWAEKERAVLRQWYCDATRSYDPETGEVDPDEVGT